MDHVSERTADGQPVVWGVAGALSPEIYGRVMAHPEFPAAARGLASAMLDLASRDRVLDSVFKDAGLYVAAMWSYLLHLTGDLTLARLKDIGRRSGLLSPGRARSLLQYLQHIGYVAPLPGVGRGLYRPTPIFVAAWTGHMRAALAAALILEPGLAAVLDAFESPSVADTLLAIHAEMLLISIESAAAPALMGAFMHARAGTQVLGALLLTSEANAFPPYRAGPITLSSLAARFGVSRAHLRRMFDGAARQGLTRLGADGRVTFEAAAREQLSFIYAGQLAALIAAATMTAQVRGLSLSGAAN